MVAIAAKPTITYILLINITDSLQNNSKCQMELIRTAFTIIDQIFHNTQPTKEETHKLSTSSK